VLVTVFIDCSSGEMAHVRNRNVGNLELYDILYLHDVVILICVFIHDKCPFILVVVLPNFNKEVNINIQIYKIVKLTMCKT
jgi:hypothetical protein